MKTTVLIVGLLLSPLALAQQAQTVSQRGSDADQQAATAQSELRADQNISDRHCLRHTGSRITADRERRARNPAAVDQAGKQASAADCAPVVGRAYSRADIERTGAVDLADALRRLDSAFW